MTKRTALLVLAVTLLPAPLRGQSLLNAAGIGLPADPVDARARALGGIGVGLRGASLLATDPAAAAFFDLPAVVMTAQPSWVELDRTDSDGTTTYRGTRFPLLGIAYPAFGLAVVTLSAESVLDQRFEVVRPLSIDIGEGPEPATDEFVSDGGVSQVRLGVARALSDNVAVGVSVGRYTGSVVRRLTRAIDEDTTDTGPGLFDPYQSGGLWDYSGTSLTAGTSVTLGTFARMAASFTWSGALSAEASDDTEGGDRSFDIPLRLRVGASAVLAPGLSVNAGLSTADWSSIDDDLAEGASVGRTLSYGLGVELTRATLFGRSAPLRFGYHRADLPFALSGDGPTESALTGGLGLALSQTGELVRASVDVSLERGSRSDGLVDERFWRAAVTLRLAGF